MNKPGAGQDVPAERTTSTSTFGVSRRENHDSSDFYARFAAPALSTDDIVNLPGSVNRIHHGDACAPESAVRVGHPAPTDVADQPILDTIDLLDDTGRKRLARSARNGPGRGPLGELYPPPPSR